MLKIKNSLFENKGTKQRILKNFSWLTFTEIVSKGIGFVAVAYLARILGVEGFGKLEFSIAILSYFALISSLGLETFGIREIAQGKEINKYVNNILTIRLIASLIAFCLLSIFVYFIPKPLEIKNLILFSGLMLFVTAFALEWFFRGIERMEFVALFRIIQQLGYLGLILLIIKSPEQLLKIPFIQVSAGLVAVCVLLSVFRKKFGSIRLNFDLPFWKKILKQSLPMGFSAIMITIYYNFDSLMLGFMKDMATVGWYNAAYRILLLALILPSLILGSFFPSLAKYYKKNKDKLKKIANKYVMIMFTLGIPFGFGGVILAPQIIRLVYGQGFDNAILPLQILVWDIVMIFINVAYGNPLLAWNKQKKYMKIITVGSITNLLFNFLLIPKYSLVGASIATVLAEVAVFCGLYPEFQKTLKISIWKYSFKPLAASIIMFLFLFILSRFNNNIFLLLPAGIMLYLILIFISKVITIDDLKLLSAKK